MQILGGKSRTMKSKKIVLVVLPAVLLATGICRSDQAYAEDLSGGAVLEIKGKEDQHYGVQDPENPEKEVDPGTVAKTEGDLRIDFVPQLNFSSNKISKEDASYYVNAQLFKENIGARGTFMQVSDYRENASGWTLQVRQESQFKDLSDETNQLKGAIISFDKSWTNTYNGTGQPPVVSKEVIHLNNIGDTYNLAEAKKGTGEGTWNIIFGASADNKDGQTPTLSPLLDEKNQPVTDAAFGDQPVYKNSAVRLSIPASSEKKAGNYSTVLTWIIAELP